MKPPEKFETERLILRKPRMDDAPEIFTSYAQDLEVTRYIPHSAPLFCNQTQFPKFSVWVKEPIGNLMVLQNFRVPRPTKK